MTKKFYGKYGDLRRTYIQEHTPKLWMVLVNTGRVTEELKASDQMAWVGLMNNCKARGEEIILSELIYC